MLTTREREILQLLADGMSNADVAAAALHLAGDREEPRPAHPHEARGRHPHARGRDRASRSDHRLEGARDGGPLDRLIAAEQDERRRIALFLHDGPVQNLAGIALMLDAALHSVQTGKLEDARERARHRARAPARDDPRAARPVVRARAGRAARPGVRARARRRSPTQLGTANEIRVDLDVDDARARSAQTAQVALYTIIRELLDQAIRRGPPTRIAVSDRARPRTAASRRSIARRRRAGAAPALVRGDRRARQAAARHDRGRRRRHRHAGRGDAAAVRDPAVRG